MILADQDILARLNDGSLVVKPLIDLETQLQPASLDLRLGRSFQVYRWINDHSPRHAMQNTDPRDPTTLDVFESIEVSDRFVLLRQELVLATTAEEVTLPPDLVARLEGRSSWGRLGLSVHSTAGFIDPGFHGQITLELVNHGPKPLVLYPGCRICQVTFEQMSRPVTSPYGLSHGKYQHQTNATLSRLYLDPEMQERPTYGNAPSD